LNVFHPSAGSNPVSGPGSARKSTHIYESRKKNSKVVRKADRPSAYEHVIGDRGGLYLSNKLKTSFKGINNGKMTAGFRNTDVGFRSFDKTKGARDTLSKRGHTLTSRLKTLAKKSKKGYQLGSNSVSNILGIKKSFSNKKLHLKSKKNQLAAYHSLHPTGNRVTNTSAGGKTPKANKPLKFYSSERGIPMGSQRVPSEYNSNLTHSNVYRKVGRRSNESFKGLKGTNRAGK
jgi:hypothetical protein